MTGVHLGQTSPEVIAELHRALLEWKVLFFAEQHLTTEQHLSLARHWGDVAPLPFFPETERGVSLIVKDAQAGGSENIWHTDQSFIDPVPFGSILRAVEVPAVGGDTVWADMGAAYDNLAADIRDEIDGLKAVHTWARAWEPFLDPVKAADLHEQLPPVEHPVVFCHPETGRRTLFVNGAYTDRIVDVDSQRSSCLLAMLGAQAAVPEYQVRFHWQPGSVAIWDNRAVQHYAISDYYPQRRVMERVVIAGSGRRAWDNP